MIQEIEKFKATLQTHSQVVWKPLTLKRITNSLGYLLVQQACPFGPHIFVHTLVLSGFALPLPAIYFPWPGPSIHSTLGVNTLLTRLTSQSKVPYISRSHESPHRDWRRSLPEGTGFVCLVHLTSQACNSTWQVPGTQTTVK